MDNTYAIEIVQATLVFMKEIAWMLISTMPKEMWVLLVIIGFLWIINLRFQHR